MRDRTRLLTLAACAGLAVAGCAGEREGRASAPLETTVVLEEQPLDLDQRADGARIVGRLEPVPPNADPDRVLVIQLLRDGASIAQELAPGLDGMRVVDARFVGDAVVTIGADHVLRVHAGGRTAELDSHAYEPLSVAGTAVAYVRGELPFFEVARADVATGAVVAVTQGMAPAWSPALTPDGRAIVFVSGAEGSPRFYRIDGTGTRALPPTARTPSSPIAPRFEDGLLVFHDEQGQAWVDLERGAIVRSSGGVR